VRWPTPRSTSCRCSCHSSAFALTFPHFCGPHIALGAVPHSTHGSTSQCLAAHTFAFSPRLLPDPCSHARHPRSRSVSVAALLESPRTQQKRVHRIRSKVQSNFFPEFWILEQNKKCLGGSSLKSDEFSRRGRVPDFVVWNTGTKRATVHGQTKPVQTMFWGFQPWKKTVHNFVISVQNGLYRLCGSPICDEFLQRLLQGKCHRLAQTFPTFW
jgi:hypothetical protein